MLINKKTVIRFSSVLLIFAGFVLLSNTFSPAEITLEDYVVEEGFELKVIASEPLFKAPVTMDFDDQGRMWVVEMISYMPNLEGLGENEQTGRITILEDFDNDGIVDNAKVFLDELILPRAIAHVYGGLLYTDGPALWFTEIKKDKPGKKTLVDPTYADGGNVEHQPNGLMMSIDNWIYNANSNFRYRLKNGKWLKEPTSYRGQWGISKDNFGRLYFNNNSTLLKGDQVLANTVIRNSYFKPRNSVDQRLTDNQKVYPLHATAVNRGYQKGVLDENGKLKTVTASCGPLVYRGGQFPNDYNQNVFVCVPEGNLIKRNTLIFNTLDIQAEQTWDDKEFIASTDEGFRPVNLFNGPDGAMYVVDMHRGIIQHKAFISQYLTKLLSDKKLDTLQNMGRILKVINKNSPLPAIPDLSQASTQELLLYLDNKNGWIRDRAQQILIDKKGKKLKSQLFEIAKSETQHHGNLHALYVLEGMDALKFEQLEILAKNSQQEDVIPHVLRIMEQYAGFQNMAKMREVAKGIMAQNNMTFDFYLTTSLHDWLKVQPDAFDEILAVLIKKYDDNKLFAEALTSSLDGQEDRFLRFSGNKNLESNLKTALKNRENEEQNNIYVNVGVRKDARTNGLNLYRSICGACHGADGSGIEDLAPPLKNSEYINGSVKRIAAIILHGISGPINVNGVHYELNNEMPALASNEEISDSDIADIINFTQNAYAKNGKRISANDVKKMREIKPANGGLFDEKQLQEIDFDVK